MAAEMSRRSFCASAAALALSGPAKAQPSEPVRVGLLTVRTGVLAAGGKQMENGLQYFLNARKNTLAGRRIELVVADTGGTPTAGKSKAEELIEKSKVDVLIGPYSSAEALAITDTIAQARVPIIQSSAGADDITQRKRNPYTVRAVATSSQMGYALAEHCLKNTKYRKIVSIAQDSNYGYELVGGFQRLLEAGGGKVIQKVWSPLFGSQDLAPYLSQLDPACDAVFNALSGADSPRFFKIAREYGFSEGRGIICPPGSVDETLLAGMGDEVLGAISCGWFSPTSGAPGSAELAEGFRAQFKVDPGALATGSILSGLILEAALARLQGDVSDKGAFAGALHQVTLEQSPFGKVALDSYGNAILTMFIRRTVRSGGRLTNETIGVIPDVSQFWTFDPATQLASAPYSRN